mmetsp:Transcript_4631/g.7077  ORF Transcript_4631/g.7077 Transcript_4631/m.7077 type:complete len:93 (-) Transcript_4631:229-507(-)
MMDWWWWGVLSFGNWSFLQPPQQPPPLLLNELFQLLETRFFTTVSPRTLTTNIIECNLLDVIEKMVVCLLYCIGRYKKVAFQQGPQLRLFLF